MKLCARALCRIKIPLTGAVRLGCSPVVKSLTSTMLGLARLSGSALLTLSHPLILAELLPANLFTLAELSLSFKLFLLSSRTLSFQSTPSFSFWARSASHLARSTSAFSLCSALRARHSARCSSYSVFQSSCEDAGSGSAELSNGPSSAGSVVVSAGSDGAPVATGACKGTFGTEGGENASDSADCSSDHFERQRKK